MAWIKTKIVGCRVASIRSRPWDPSEESDVIDIRDGSYERSSFIRHTGDTVEIDPENVMYSWTDRKYYKIRDPDGWIYEGCVEFGGDTNDSR